MYYNPTTPEEIVIGETVMVNGVLWTITSSLKSHYDSVPLFQADRIGSGGWEYAEFCLNDLDVTPEQSPEPDVEEHCPDVDGPCGRW